MIGTLFGGYLILSKLGEGGMGEVYRARGGDGQEVALKLILDSALSSDAAPDLRRRFRRELKIALELDHPNLVRTLTGGEIEGSLFMVCALVPGGSLQDLLDVRKALPAPQVLSVVRDLFHALREIETRGLIHRDIKPANILLDADGCAKLSDLGLARSTDHERTILTAPGSALGTPHYMAPEQIMGSEQLDIRCDLYAAGALAFRCLVGQPPFVGKTATQIVKSHLSAPVPDLRGRFPEVGDELAHLIAALLQKDADDRPVGPSAVLDRFASLFDKAEALSLEGVAAASAPAIDESQRRTVTLGQAPQRTASGSATELLPAGGASPDATMTSQPTLSGHSVGTVGPTGAGTMSGSETLDGGVEASSLATLPTGAFESLRVEGETSGPGLTRARLVVGSGPGARTLFVYGGGQLQMGRNAVDYQGQDVCLRLRPGRGAEAETQKISGKHLEVRASEAGAFVRDLGSRQGTRLEGQSLIAGSDAPLSAVGTLEVARVLELTIHAIPPPGSATPAVLGIGSPAPRAPALFLSRPRNGSEHAYALIPGRLALDLGPQGSLLPSPPKTTPPAPVELFWIASGQTPGALWLRGGGLAPGSCQRLQEGASFEIRGLRVAIYGIRPEDQKG